MSDADAGEGRRRRSRRGLRFSWAWAAVGALVLLLVVNLAMSLPALLSGETPDGILADLVSEKRLEHIGLWVALLPAAAAAVMGIRWAHEAWSRSERPAALWLRRSFVVSLTAWIALLVVIMDAAAFPDRNSVGIAAAVLLSATLIPFAVAARAASLGRYGGRGPGGGEKRRKRRSSADGNESEDA